MFLQGAPPDYVYVILSGRVRVYRQYDDGGKVEIAVLGNGDLFGEMALLDGEPRSASISTLEPCEFFVLGRDDFIRFLAEFPPLSPGLIASMTGRIRSSNEKFFLEVLEKQAIRLEMERKRAEEELRKSEERYRRIIDTANEGIWMLDPEGNTLLANRQMAEMLGCSLEELSCSSVYHFIYEEDLAQAHERLSRRFRAEREQRDCRFRRKDGSELWAIVNSTPMLEDDGRCLGTLGMLTDIVERKRLEDQLRQAQKMEAIGQLAGGVAHDFNNMLNVILGYSETLRERLSSDNSLVRMVEQIQKAGGRAAALTRQLLAFSRKQLLRPTVLDLNAVVVEAETMIRRLIGEHIEVVTLLGPNLGKVKTDQGQMEQVIVNMAVNARDAMPQGGKLILSTANVEIDEEYTRRRPMVPTGRYVRLAVSDTGTGMDRATRARIFEPFFTTKEAGKGTGLGLATVYGIVKQSGGYIWVYSEPGQGTAFKIYLPQVDEEGVVWESRQQIPVAAAASNMETILLVEDEESLRELTREFLESSGYNVLEASGGQEALEIAGKHGPIHLLVTDVVMPRMSGPVLAKHLALLQPLMKVLFVSGYTGEHVNHFSGIDSDTAFLEKPFTKNDLVSKVQELLTP
ncbi:MAG: PAS domain S-box protein [Acidobacteria bacterium]|nr:PAS domain S-box protein [Acidobacteriota bacterium]